MRLAIIDDHPISISGVMAFLEGITPPPTMTGFNTLEAFDRAHRDGARFNLALLDLKLPGHGGLSALRAFRAAYPDIPVVVHSATDDPRTIWSALDELHAMGYIPKSATGEVMISAIELVLAGGTYVPSEVFNYPQAQERAAVAPTDAAGQPLMRRETDRARTRVLGSLTKRQRDVLELLLKGLPDKVICRELDLSANTVKTHKNAIFRAFDVDSRTKVVIAAHKFGLRVDWDESTAR